MSQDSDTGAFLAGFVIGGLVGAAAALIMAPQSGEATRSQLAARSRELRQAGEEQFGTYQQRVSQVATTARSQVEDTTDEIQEQARIVLDEGKTRVEKGRARVSETIDHGKERVTGAIERTEAKADEAAETAKEETTEAIEQAEETIDEVAEITEEKVEEVAEAAEDEVEGSA